MAKRKTFDLKKFFQDYPLIPLLTVVFSVGILIGFVLGQKSAERPAEAHLEKTELQTQRVALPDVEDVAALPVEKPVPPAAREVKIAPLPFFPFQRTPKIAFVIDDVGNSKHYADALFSFPKPVAIAILPQLAFSKYFAEEGKARGLETILHLPLEPDDHDYNPGAGEIKTSMSEIEIREILIKNLETVPGVSGVNNHMGSHATRNPRLMSVVLKELKERNLFFLDSMTHPDSIAYEKARASGVPTLKRDVFIDNEDSYDYIRGQIREAAAVAKANGSAVAIGHVHDNTLRALKDAMPELEAQGIQIVHLKDLLS